MIERRYFSNISPRWPLEKQRALLGSGQADYVDEIGPAAIKRREPVALKERTDLLRRTSRQTPEVILVAAWPVLAFGWTDFADVIAAAHRRNATLRAVSTGDEIPPDATPDVIAEAIKAFANEARSRGLARSRDELAEIKRQETLRRIEIIRPLWPLRTHATSALLEMAGTGKHPMAPATAKAHLGSRPKVQADYEREQAREDGRKAAREARKAKKQ